MTQTIIAAIIYLVGAACAKWMQRVELESEGKPLTKGLNLVTLALSVFSWLTVLFLLVSAWIGMIGPGYWSKPVNPQPAKEPETPKKEADK